MRGHIVFNGPSRLLKLFVADDDGGTQLRHEFECHDVGVRDGVDPDPFGHECKCPPGLYYVGAPQPLAPPERPYGFFFTPLYDNPLSNAFAAHGRSGIGIHGGGSDLADPFAARQGWEWTFGCLRLQNEDNATLAEYCRFIRAHTSDPDHAITLSVWWGDRYTKEG